MPMLQYLVLWFHDGGVLLPTIAETSDGLTMEVDPVQRLEATLDGIGPALAAAVAATPQTISHPDPASWPRSAVQKAAGARSWRAFARTALAVVLVKDPAGWEVSVVAQGPKRTDERVIESRRLSSPCSAAQLTHTILELAVRADIWKVPGGHGTPGSGASRRTTSRVSAAATERVPTRGRRLPEA